MLYDKGVNSINFLFILKLKTLIDSRNILALCRRDLLNIFAFFQKCFFLIGTI